jgi:3-oxoacyl-[acyl-carrier protein] reductase
MRFDQKVAFITGAAIGFGRAFGRALGQEGAAIAVVDIDGDAAERTAKEFESEGIKALPVTCDVASENDVDRAVEATVSRFGGVDILINNAGKHLTKYNQPFSVLPRFELRALFDVNVIGVVNCTVSCKPTMAARGGGAVVNISSIAGHLASSPYGVSKLAVRGLTVAFANELAPDGIRVNAISPGLMATENAMEDLPKEMVDDFVQNRQLVHRLGTMEDIVKTMMFLCSDDASFITGETIMVSGGYPPEV